LISQILRDIKVLTFQQGDNTCFKNRMWRDSPDAPSFNHGMRSLKSSSPDLRFELPPASSSSSSSPSTSPRSSSNSISSFPRLPQLRIEVNFVPVFSHSLTDICSYFKKSALAYSVQELSWTSGQRYVAGYERLHFESSGLSNYSTAFSHPSYSQQDVLLIYYDYHLIWLNFPNLSSSNSGFGAFHSFASLTNFFPFICCSTTARLGTISCPVRAHLILE